MSVKLKPSQSVIIQVEAFLVVMSYSECCCKVPTFRRVVLRPSLGSMEVTRSSETLVPYSNTTLLQSQSGRGGEGKKNRSIPTHHRQNPTESINSSCVEVVALIRRVYFYISSQKLVIGF